MKYGFGIDVGGTTIKMGLLDDTGTLIEKRYLRTYKTMEKQFCRKLRQKFLHGSGRKTLKRRKFWESASAFRALLMKTGASTAASI